MVSILIISCKFNFSSSHAMYLKLYQKLPGFDFQHLYFIPACDWNQLPSLVCRHALEFFIRLDLSVCVELLQRLQLEINSLNTERSYIMRLRCSACQITNPNGRPMLPCDWLIWSSLILASCHSILFLCRFSAVKK